MWQGKVQSRIFSKALVGEETAPGNTGEWFKVLPEVKELVVLRKSNTDVILELAKTMVPTVVEEGTTIAQQGQPDDSMYIIAEVLGIFCEFL